MRRRPRPGSGPQALPPLGRRGIAPHGWALRGYARGPTSGTSRVPVRIPGVSDDRALPRPVPRADASGAPWGAGAGARPHTRARAASRAGSRPRPRAAGARPRAAPARTGTGPRTADAHAQSGPGAAAALLSPRPSRSLGSRRPPASWETDPASGAPRSALPRTRRPPHPRDGRGRPTRRPARPPRRHQVGTAAGRDADRPARRVPCDTVNRTDTAEAAAPTVLRRSTVPPAAPRSGPASAVDRRAGRTRSAAPGRGAA
jgi:hypothetical protein